MHIARVFERLYTCHWNLPHPGEVSGISHEAKKTAIRPHVKEHFFCQHPNQMRINPAQGGGGGQALSQ